MIAVLVHAFWRGDFGSEGNLLLQMPWGRATLVDVYVGLGLFCAWVWWREPSRFAAAAWVVAILAIGNLATCGYVLYAAAGARGRPESFWMGDRRET